MTHAEAIQKLDAAIAHVRTYNTSVTSEKNAEWNGQTIKQIALRALKEVGAPMSIQQSVDDLFFGREDRTGMNFNVAVFGFKEASRITSETYLQGVKNTIDILQAERDRHERAKADDTENKNRKLSIIAIAIALLSLIVSILK